MALSHGRDSDHDNDCVPFCVASVLPLTGTASDLGLRRQEQKQLTPYTIHIAYINYPVYYVIQYRVEYMNEGLILLGHHPL